MKLNIFRKKSTASFFDAEHWRFDEVKNMYCLILKIAKSQCTPNFIIYLYKKQGERYIFMSEGYEAISGNELVYYSLSPFSGKIRIK